MKARNKTFKNLVPIPVIADTERFIDGQMMIRCTYFSIQSDEPLPDWRLQVRNFNIPLLLLNLEAILTGSPNKRNRFESVHDIESMYNYVEENKQLFVDINEIWIPTTWFTFNDIKQGMVFRISNEVFTVCWKYRNDKISVEEMISNENILSKLNQEQPLIIYSESETHAFKQWTGKQIEHSRARYNENKDRLLKRIQ